MKKKIVLKLIVALVTIGIIYEGYGMIKEFTKQNKVENVKTMNIFNNKDKTLSIMLQEDGINFTEATNRDAWPDIKKYTYDKSECVDSTGANVDYKSILTFNYDSETPTVTVKTKNTVYCTLYFVKGRDTLTLLQEKGSTTFVEKGGMWRFVGLTSKVKNNYICFGTTDTSLCKSQPDKYMYRIIGMTKEGDATLDLHANQLKLIKATPSNESQAWYSDYSSNIEWEASEVYDYLNGTETDDFLPDAKTNQWQTGDYWDSLITSQKWYIQDQTSIPTATPEPTGKTTTAAAKIGLMYATDFVNAGGVSSTNYWLNLRNGWTGNSTILREWTMSRYGLKGASYSAWLVDNDGKLTVDYYHVNYTGAVRPVFYLKSSVMLSGVGSTDDPFKIAG